MILNSDNGPRVITVESPLTEFDHFEQKVEEILNTIVWIR